MGESRRNFLKKTAAALVAGGGTISGAVVGRGVTIITDPADAVAREQPVRWALRELQGALKRRGLGVELREAGVPEVSFAERVVVAQRSSTLARAVHVGAGIAVPDAPESLALVRGKELLVTGSDARGLVYALPDLADRVELAPDQTSALRGIESAVQRPANPIRSVTRNFTSEPEDKPWFHDRAFWENYLTMLARERFNRFSLAFGLGYNSPHRVPDSYFYFAYPFLVAV